MHKKRGIKNLLFGLLSQIITIAMGLVIPRLFLVSFGSEYNGFLSSITQVFSYMALLEAGVATATLQALYGPIARNDDSKVNGILSATNRYYQKTGFFYFLGVLVFALVYPLIVPTEIPFLNIVWIILLNGMGGVVNYFFQGKFRLLLQAEGKSYILTNLATIINILSSATKIVLIMLHFNIIVVQLGYFIFQMAQMLFVMFYIKRNYNWLDLSVAPDYLAIAHKNSVIIHEISYLIFNNTDVLVLTMFCGLKTASVYVMYMTFFNMINSLLGQFFQSFTFSLGQIYNTDRERYVKIHGMYEMLYMPLVFGLYLITYHCILPFMRLYTAGINDINYINYWLPVLFVILHLLIAGRSTVSLSIRIGGFFKETQWRSVLESVINIVISLACVYSFGMVGVLIGTITAVLYRTIDMILFSSKYILKQSPWKSFRRWLINAAVFVVLAVVMQPKAQWVSSYQKIVLTAIGYGAISVPAFLIVNFCIDRESFRFFLQNIKGILAGRATKA